jgi:glycosyltransferase involved in cell wall biosynthesis
MTDSQPTSDFKPGLAPTYSLVVPVYNSTESLVELCDRVAKTFTETLRESFEIILIDDASPNPETWTTMEAIATENPHVRVFQLMRNAGQHNATMCGLKQARGSYIITMDDDLQHYPEEIPVLVEALRSRPDCDAIMGVPERRHHSAFRNLGSFLANKLVGLAMSKPKGVTFSSFRIITRELKDALVEYRGHMITLGSLMCLCTQRLGSVQVKQAPRKHGRSGYSLAKLFNLALSNVFNFSALPLQVLSVFGLVLAVLAALYALLIVYQRLTGQIGQAGFATLAVLISFFSGAILMSIGVLGQYLIRVLRATTVQRQFTIRRRVEREDPSR